MRHLFLLFIFLFITMISNAQNNEWPSPEVAQMYMQAKEYQSKGAQQESISILQKAIQLAPQVTVLRQDLANSYNRAGNYTAAYQTIQPLLKEATIEENTYYIAGMALQGMGEKKKAKSIFEKGIKNYPYSGMLYNSLGHYYQNFNDPEFALSSWLSGIENHPTYALNYYDVAKLYATTNQPFWAIIYGEQYLQLISSTTQNDEIRRLLFSAYAKLYNNFFTASANNTQKTNPSKIDFENAALAILKQLTPVVADGTTTDNLTMLRTRFVMDWMDKYAAVYPFSLFSYQDQLLRDGQFEAYNQWLFGKAENEALYNSWTTFNPDAMPSLNAWMKKNKYNPSTAEFYHSKNVKSLFNNSKR